MVQLSKWFQTDSSYILLLQYAGGGKLIDYINSYQRKTIANVEADTEDAQDCSSTPFSIQDPNADVILQTVLKEQDVAG